MTSQVSSTIFHGLGGMAPINRVTNLRSYAAHLQASPTISIDDAAALIEYCVVELDWPGFFEELTKRQGLDFLGGSSEPLQAARTACDLLHAIERELGGHAQPLNFKAVALGGGWFTLNCSLDIAHLSPLQRYLCMELCISQTVVGLRQLIGAAVTISSIHRRFNTPPELIGRRHCHGIPVINGEVSDGLIFQIDEEVFAERTQSCGDVHQETSGAFLHARDRFDGLESKVELIVRSLIPHRPCRIDDVAHALHCDKRTLQRHLLAATGRPFRDIYARIRFEMVLEKLSHSRASISEIARLAGFEQASNFSRAFRCRYGISPRQWRSQVHPAYVAN